MYFGQGKKSVKHTNEFRVHSFLAVGQEHHQTTLNEEDEKKSNKSAPLLSIINVFN